MWALWLVLLTGCGTTTAEGPTPAERRSAAAERKAAEARQEAAKEFRTCRRELQPLINALEELDSRLAVGLNYERYSERVGDVQVAYDKVNFSPLSYECLQAGSAAEAALKSYIKAYNAWDRCFDDYDCSLDSIEPELQRHWLKATRQIDRAKDNLAEMKP